MEGMQCLHLLGTPRGEAEQPPRGSRDQHAVAAFVAKLHGLREYTHAPGSPGSTALAGTIDRGRPQGVDAAYLGARQPVRPLRAGYDNPLATQVIEMAAGDTSGGSRPFVNKNGF